MHRARHVQYSIVVPILTNLAHALTIERVESKNRYQNQQVKTKRERLELRQETILKQIANAKPHEKEFYWAEFARIERELNGE